MLPVGVLPSVAVFPAAHGLHEESDVVFASIPGLIPSPMVLASLRCGVALV